MNEFSRLSCEQFALLVQDFSRQRELDAVTRRAGELHVRSCSACATSLRAADSLTDALRELAATSKRDQAPRRIELALLTAFQERSRGTIPSQLRLPSWRRAQAWAAMAAVLFLVVFAVGKSRWPVLRGGENPSRQFDAGGKGTRAVAASRGMPRQSADRAPDSSILRRNPSNAASNPKEEALEFFPLHFVEGSSALEDFQLVRVRLSGTALLALGFDMDQDRARESFLADVLLAEDGQARGIRIVTPEP